MNPVNTAAQLMYVQWQDLYKTEKPFQIFVATPENEASIRDTNLVFELGDEQTIHDIRGNEAAFSLDHHGFTVSTYDTKMTAWDSVSTIESIYLPEIESLISGNVEGADRVFIFDWRIRRDEGHAKPEKTINLNDKMDHLAPAMHVHVDQSPGAVLKRVQLQLKDDTERLLRGRTRVINAWRPLQHVVSDWPLALCDGSTVQESDLIAADHVRRHYTGETLYVQQNKNHRWHYMNNQQKHEVFLFKNFDSDDVQAKCCPHASFKCKNIPPNAMARESIEVRALVFTDEVKEDRGD